ncbi:hypothetical protein B0H17DRAFT_1127739 [Mycena rosella]|uniref:Uncharacterized protein n=1 Tax=Mycena rosella TaxID=1033263 RepID=A0AAD7E1A8_MYCRO|nr:hypothetical protein B0H17DRAFT_1127739 [Mycena rosella]
MEATTNNATTHASCNPTKDVQNARGRKKGEPLTDAQKATHAAATVKRKVLVEDFNEDLDKFCALRAQTAAELAAKYNRTVKYIMRFLNNTSAFTKPPGKTFKLPELHQMADNVLANYPPTDEEAAELIETLHVHPKLKCVGLHALNTAAAVDSRSTVADIQDEMKALFERTGTRGFGFFTRGHLDDTSMPTALQSGESLAFCVEVLKKPAVDVLRLYEQWSCSRETDKLQHDNRQAMCAQTARIIEAKLCELTHSDTISVSYKNMDLNIRETWKCEIAGWPTDIPIIAPAQIKPIECLRHIRDRWVKGDITWVSMTAVQVKELAIDLAAHREKNGGILKARKTRKDAGQKHTSMGKGAQKKRTKVHKSDHEAPAKSMDKDVYNLEGEHERPAVSRRTTRASEVTHASLASSQSPTVAAAAAHTTVPAVVVHATAVLVGGAHTATVLANAAQANIVLADVTHMTTIPADIVHSATHAVLTAAGAADTHAAPDASLIASQSPVDMRTVPATSSFMPTITPTSFIAYTPGAALTNQSNVGPRKPKATEDLAGGALPKKACQPRSDKGTKRGPKGSNGAGSSSTMRRTPGSGCTRPKMTPVARLPRWHLPRPLIPLMSFAPTERSSGGADGIGARLDGGARPRDVCSGSTAGAQRAGDGELSIANGGGADADDPAVMAAPTDAELMPRWAR